MIFQEVQSPVQQRQKQAKKNASSVVRIKSEKNTFVKEAMISRPDRSNESLI